MTQWVCLLCSDSLSACNFFTVVVVVLYILEGLHIYEVYAMLCNNNGRKKKRNANFQVVLVLGTGLHAPASEEEEGEEGGGRIQKHQSQSNSLHRTEPKPTCCFVRCCAATQNRTTTAATVVHLESLRKHLGQNLNFPHYNHQMNLFSHIIVEWFITLIRCKSKSCW